MELTTNYTDRTDEVIELFNSTFAASEGAAEGELIAQLVREMFATVSPEDIFVFLALDNEAITGAIIFTRLTYPDDARTVFVLAPVAVATSQQGKGVGQALLNYGLSHLRDCNVDVALTYGDPSYYTRVGFEQISDTLAQPPLKLEYPEGWLGQSLSDKPLTQLSGRSHCVEALNSPNYW
ncbi:MAG: GNAT family N-acetyltransferase [Roseovarius sp.]